MNPGELDKKIAIQKPGMVENEIKEKVPGYLPFRTPWANIKPIQGREYYEAQKINTEITHRIKTRYMKDLTADMRIVYKGRIFEIKSIINVDEANKELEIMCIEKVS